MHSPGSVGETPEAHTLDAGLPTPRKRSTGSLQARVEPGDLSVELGAGSGDPRTAPELAYV